MGGNVERRRYEPTRGMTENDVFGELLRRVVVGRCQMSCHLLGRRHLQVERLPDGVRMTEREGGRLVRQTDVPFTRPGHLVTENEDRRRFRVEEVGL